MIRAKYPVIDVIKTGKHIKSLRKDWGCSANEIAEFMGFREPASVYKWERGGALPTVDHLFALSRLLNVPMNDILVEK